MKTVAVTLLGALALSACGSGTDRPALPQPPPTPDCNDAVEFCGTVPTNVSPCIEEEYWPLRAESSLRPFIVHYSRMRNESKALEIVALLEESWSVQVDMVGFSPPLDDGGLCGPDGKYDVFIWPGIGGAFVSAIFDNPSTPWEDVSTYMAIDVAGATGGELLNTYIAHEFNHSLQASDDWDETSQHYEAGATFAEALVYPDDNDWFFTMRDFQDSPDWNLFMQDFGTSWYTYGAAMYLHYLYERFFPGDPAFYARIWRGARSNEGADRPDYIDALRQVLLNERGVTIDDTIVEFSQWRWFVGDSDDEAHFSKGGEWPHNVAVTEVDAASIPVTQNLNAMEYGANFFRITNNGAADITFNAAINSADIDITWRLLDVEAGDITAPITLAPAENIVLVAVVMPMSEVWSGNLSFVFREADLELTTFP